VKRIVSLFFAPLLALAAGAAGVELWLMYGNQVDAGLLELAMVASAVFAVVLVLVNHILAWITASKISRLHAGTASYERDIRQRLEVLSGTSVSLKELEQLDQRLGALEQRLPDTGHAITLFSSQDSNSTQDLVEEPMIEEAAMPIASNDAKVIQLDPAKRAAAVASKEIPRVSVPKNLTELLNDGGLKMFLQPIVSLPGREVPGYEALARLVLEDGTVITAPEFWAQAEKSNLVARIDRQILEQAVRLMRSQRRKKQPVEVFWNVSPATLRFKQTFAPVLEILQANKLLARTLIAEMSQDDFESLSRTQLKNLTKIHELGFRLSLDHCTNIESVRNITASGLFSFVKVPVSILEQFAGRETEHFAERLAALFHDNPVRLIASGVEQERQVMKLIDHDILLAQGGLFSPPRPLRTQADAQSKQADAENLG